MLADIDYDLLLVVPFHAVQFVKYESKNWPLRYSTPLKYGQSTPFPAILHPVKVAKLKTLLMI